MLKTFIKAKDGNFSIIMAVILGVLALGVAAAVEISRAQSLDTTLQDSLDIATLYAAQIAEEDDFEDDSVHHFNENFRTRHKASITSVDFDIIGDEVIGTASAEMSLVFAGLLNREKLNIVGRSVVKLGVPDRSPCLVALSETRRPGILMNGGANVVTSDCEVHVHSIQNPAFTINSGTNLDAERICVAGNNIRNNGGNISNAEIERNCPVISDPYAGVFPIADSSDCDFDGRTYEMSNVSLTPGVYCGTHNFKDEVSTVNFAPGTYVISGGGWVIDGGVWTGTGITFYYADNADIHFNSGVRATMSAPTSGPYKDVFMTESPNITNTGRQWVLDDSEGFDFEGVIYLPTRQVVFNSNADLRSLRLDIVADSIIFNDVNVELEPINSTNSRSGLVYLSE